MTLPIAIRAILDPVLGQRLKRLGRIEVLLGEHDVGRHGAWQRRRKRYERIARLAGPSAVAQSRVLQSSQPTVEIFDVETPGGAARIIRYQNQSSTKSQSWLLHVTYGGQGSWEGTETLSPGGTRTFALGSLLQADGPWVTSDGRPPQPDAASFIAWALPQLLAHNQTAAAAA